MVLTNIFLRKTLLLEVLKIHLSMRHVTKIWLDPLLQDSHPGFKVNLMELNPLVTISRNNILYDLFHESTNGVSIRIFQIIIFWILEMYLPMQWLAEIFRYQNVRKIVHLAEKNRSRAIREKI